jgi:hypothetical protein
MLEGTQLGGIAPQPSSPSELVHQIARLDEDELDLIGGVAVYRDLQQIVSYTRRETTLYAERMASGLGQRLAAAILAITESNTPLPLTSEIVPRRVLDEALDIVFPPFDKGIYSPARPSARGPEGLTAG